MDYRSVGWTGGKAGLHTPTSGGLCGGVGLFICALENESCETIRKLSFISLFHCFILASAALAVSAIELGRRGRLFWGFFGWGFGV